MQGGPHAGEARTPIRPDTRNGQATGLALICQKITREKDRGMSRLKLKSALAGTTTAALIIGGVTLGAGQASADGIAIDNPGYTPGATAAGTWDIAIGIRAEADGGSGSAVAIGSTTQAIGYRATALGGNSSATADWATAVGHSFALGQSSTAIGGAQARADYATALGSSNANGTNSVAIGSLLWQWGGTGSVQAVTDYTGTTYLNTAAVGANSIAMTGVSVGDNSAAIGYRSVANYANDVALGAGSLTAATVGTPSTTINGKAYTFAGVNPTSTVSVGSAGSERTITNVAAGRISATSTDAVNGSELFATNTHLATVASNTSTYLGGGADVALGVAPTYTVQGTTYHDVGSALGGINSNLTTIYGDITNLDNGAAGTVQRGKTNQLVLVAPGGSGAAPGTPQQLTNVANGAVNATSTDAINGSQLYAVQQTAGAGWNLSANGGTATNVLPGGTVDVANGANINVTQSGSMLTIATSMTPSFTTVTTTGGITAGGMINANGGLTVAAGQTVDMGGNKILNVAPGMVSSASTDAINGGQLYTVATNTSTSLGGGADVLNGTAPNYVVQGATYHDVGSALGGINGSLTTINGRVDNLGSSTAAMFGGSTTYNSATGSISDFSVMLNGVTYASVTDAFNGIESQIAAMTNPVQYSTPGSPTTPTGGAGSGGTPSNDATMVGATSGPVALHNVADGAVSNTSTDAVNGSQLHGVSSSVASALGGGATVDADGNVTAPSYTVQNNTYNNVGDALASLDTGVTDNTTAITNLTNNITNGTIGLVQQQGGPDAPITVGAQTGGTTVNFAGTSGDRVLTGVAAGSVTASSSDAINGAQLYANANSVANALGGGSSVNADGTVSAPTYKLASGTYNDVGSALGALDRGVQNSVQYDTVNGQRTNSITLQGGTAGPVTIHNVAAGVSPTDAVNVQQLNSGLAAMSGLDRAYTDAQVGKAMDRANVAGATAAAMAGVHRVDLRPHEGAISGAVGGFGGRAAIAFGVDYRFTPSIQANSAVSFAPDSNTAAWSVGASYRFN